MPAAAVTIGQLIDADYINMDYHDYSDYTDLDEQLRRDNTDWVTMLTRQGGNNTASLYGNATSLPDDQPDVIITIIKSAILVTIMLLAVFGNLLVIVSVFRFERLQIIANSFIVSLAFADLLVALLVMPFNASMEIAGKWVFGRIVCNIFNANDVLFSTASLLHICCISMDRYIAIIDPFHYESRMTKRKVFIMLFCAWGASSCISHIPIHMGWYTTEQQKNTLLDNDEICEFKVNRIYAVISSSISFWIPTVVMVFTYVKIFREARRQEKVIMKLTKIPDPASEQLNNNQRNGVHKSGTGNKLSNTKLTQNRKKLKREHKAAKTLGIIMGAFLFCWLPFFLWYIITSAICVTCPVPNIVISLLFWVGYFNSALNPMIYAFFNRDFRNAFKRLLRCHRFKRCWHRGPESDALANYGAELHARPSRQDLYDNSNSTPSPRSRRYYDTVEKS